jgi:hypothetical protein
MMQENEAKLHGDGMKIYFDSTC